MISVGARDTPSRLAREQEAHPHPSRGHPVGPPVPARCRSMGRLVGRVQAHRAVDNAVILQQLHLINTRGEQCAPAFAEPGLRVGLAKECLRW